MRIDPLYIWWCVRCDLEFCNLLIRFGYALWRLPLLSSKRECPLEFKLMHDLLVEMFCMFPSSGYIIYALNI